MMNDAIGLLCVLAPLVLARCCGCCTVPRLRLLFLRWLDRK